MAEELRLWAISVDEFRQCFAAPPLLADRLRHIAQSIAGVAASPAPHGLLNKLGPLMRRPTDAPVIRPDQPNLNDAEALMTGRYIASDRLAASWVLVRAWLDALAIAHTIIPLAQSTIDRLEFDLARAGVSTQISIRHLWGRSLDIPLRSTGDMCVGYMDHAGTTRLAEAWAAAVPELEPGTAQLATALLEFFARFPALAEASAGGDQGSPPPDLIAWWTGR